MILFYIFENVPNVWRKRRRLDPHSCSAFNLHVKHMLIKSYFLSFPFYTERVPHAAVSPRSCPQVRTGARGGGRRRRRAFCPAGGEPACHHAQGVHALLGAPSSLN